MSTQQYSHILKLERAIEHLMQLQEATVDWFVGNHHRRSWLESDPNDPSVILLKASADRIPLKPFSLIASEILHHQRSALDSLVFALAVANHHATMFPDEIAEHSQFPIVGDENREGKSGCGPQMFQRQKSRINGLHPEAQAIIEKLQPYQLGSDFRGHKLWQLAHLSNLDKHRLLHTSAVHLGGFTFPRVKTIHSIEFVSPVSAIETETIVARMKRSDFAEGDLQMNVDVGLSMNIAFADGLYEGSDIQSVLTLIHYFITREVIPPLQRFL